MELKQKLPVSYLLFTIRGRINRLTYWIALVFIWSSFYVLFNLLEYGISYTATLFIYPVLFWALIATSTKRLHDSNKTAAWLLLVAIPILGPLMLLYFLGFRKGNKDNNRFGRVPGSAPDYFINNDASKADASGRKIVNDVTQLNPIDVSEVIEPDSIEALQSIIKNATKSVSIGGGRFSMGGQTASEESIHIDMRKLNKVIAFSKENKIIKVQTGIRWCDIQHYIDPHDLSIKIMQTYANFTVGGSLNVNVHGRYIGLGPIILSVKSIDIILSDGSLQKVSRTINPELFFASVGCYNAIAVIAAAELELEDNVAVKRVQKKMKLSEYHDFFFENIRENPAVVFHNGDIYAPQYKNVRAVSWVKTDKKPTVKTRLMPLAASYPVERYFISVFSKSTFGKWRREHIIDPLLYLSKKIHWRNYEAGYDVAELEPKSRKQFTYVLQEYFIPIHQFDQFTAMMSSIFKKHHVNVLNVSIRHAKKDDGSLMAWAREEVFAFVVYYRQSTSDAAKAEVGVWTREIVDAVLSLNGSYYLPYQQHATKEQFHKAFPNANKLFEMKKKFDPGFKFRNVIWNKYYK